MTLENFPIIKETYYFKCSRCGNCCTGDQKVHLNLYDLFKLTRYHKFSHSGQLFKSGLLYLIHTKRGVFLPRIRFRIKPFHFCPYLINGEDTGLCKLHPASKPLICALAPAGRIIDFEKDSESWVFVKPAPDCPGCDVHQAQSLTQLQETYKEELHFQKRFFRLLNTIQHLSWERVTYLERLYSFSAHRPFSEILLELEKNLL